MDKDDNLLTTIEQQMEQTLMNLSDSLEKIDLTLKNIVKLTVILRNIKDFHNMHRVWTKYFKTDNYPVRTVITSDFVSENCLVQIEGIACY